MSEITEIKQNSGIIISLWNKDYPLSEHFGYMKISNFYVLFNPVQDIFSLNLP